MSNWMLLLTNSQKTLAMKIELDRDKRIALLQALKDGYIDSDTLREWIGDKVLLSDKPMTLEEARQMMRELEDDCMTQ